MRSSSSTFALRAAIVAYLMAFDSNEAPIVGQQITLTKTNATSAGPRDDDGFADLDEVFAGKNPADPNSHP